MKLSNFLKTFHSTRKMAAILRRVEQHERVWLAHACHVNAAELTETFRFLPLRIIIEIDTKYTNFFETFINIGFISRKLNY